MIAATPSPSRSFPGVNYTCAADVFLHFLWYAQAATQKPLSYLCRYRSTALFCSCYLSTTVNVKHSEHAHSVEEMQFLAYFYQMPATTPRWLFVCGGQDGMK